MKAWKQLILLGIVLTGFNGFTLQAQDILLNQFYSSPLLLSPALTGLMDDCYRINLNHRSLKTNPSGSKYASVVASFDRPILKNKLRNDYLGIGLLTSYDRAALGALENITLMSSIGYHKSLNNDRTKISLGLQAGWTTKKRELTTVFLGSYFGQPGTSPAITSEIRVETESSSYVDLNSGIGITHQANSNIEINVGFAAFHLARPTERFFGSENKIGIRSVGHARAIIHLASRHSVSPIFTYMSQTSTSTFASGIIYGFLFDENETRNTSSSIYLGCIYRKNSPLHGLLGVEFNGILIKTSFSLQALSDTYIIDEKRGQFEVSFRINSNLFSNICKG